MGSSPSDFSPSNMLSLAVDRYNCYASELVVFYLRFVVPQEPGAVLQLSLPSVMKVESYQMPAGIPSSILSLNEINQESILHFPLQEPFEVNKTYEIMVKVRVETFQMDQYLLSEARIYDRELNSLAYEAVQVTVLSHARYLQHLPELYESDDFVNRFLMLFESFWKPITQQVDQIACDFDPLLTPQTLLPWLSSWVGLSFDESLPVSRMRSLLKSSMMFYQQRGTLRALKTYLETYTGGEASIVERRAQNFVIGQQCRLGVEIALGTRNQPNTVNIDVKVPNAELTQSNYTSEMYEHKINEIVHSLVPAHTVCNIQCEFADSENIVNTKGI